MSMMSADESGVNVSENVNNMSKINLVIICLIFLAVSISCKSFMPSKGTETTKGPTVDFAAPGKPLNVKVQLDKNRTSSGKISPGGGSVSLTSADGSKFTLDVPPNALDTETTITMTAVKTLDGAPLDKNTPTAVQLEPSGLFFKEMVTLTIVPAKEIPVKEQIIFGYEGEGKDYHLALVDPKSKEIKIKLMQFSGAGVGSGADSVWAANLLIQADNAATRLSQKMGELLQDQRRKAILGEEDQSEGDLPEWVVQLMSLLDQYEDQVLAKEIVAAELDCQHAPRAIRTLLSLERTRQLLGIVSKTSKFNENFEKLLKILQNCAAPYQIVGGLDDWQTNTKVCDIMKPFTLTGGGFTMQVSGGLSGTYTYTGPFNAHGGESYTISLPDGIGKPGTMTGGGVGCAGGKCKGGTEHYTLTPIEPCG